MKIRFPAFIIDDTEAHKQKKIDKLNYKYNVIAGGVNQTDTQISFKYNLAYEICKAMFDQ